MLGPRAVGVTAVVLAERLGALASHSVIDRDSPDPSAWDPSRNLQLSLAVVVESLRLERTWPYQGGPGRIRAARRGDAALARLSI